MRPWITVVLSLLDDPDQWYWSVTQYPESGAEAPRRFAATLDGHLAPADAKDAVADEVLARWGVQIVSWLERSDDRPSHTSWYGEATLSGDGPEAGVREPRRPRRGGPAEPLRLPRP